MDLGGTEQRLRRDAAPVQADAAERFSLDQRGPHPELGRRAFALAPLVDVLPEGTCPVSGARFSDLLASLDRSVIARLAEQPAWDPRPN